MHKPSLSLRIRDIIRNRLCVIHSIAHCEHQNAVFGHLVIIRHRILKGSHLFQSLSLLNLQRFSEHGRAEGSLILPSVRSAVSLQEGLIVRVNECSFKCCSAHASLTRYMILAFSCSYITESASTTTIRLSLVKADFRMCASSRSQSRQSSR